MTAEWKDPHMEHGLPPIEGDPTQIEKNQAAIELLRSWREATGEDAEEQRETGEYLKRVLNEERARRGARLLF
jgi:hypothetical protein